MLDYSGVPNLNDPNKPGFINGYGGGAFLRGGTRSGTEQDDATKLPADLVFTVSDVAHSHAIAEQKGKGRLVVNGAIDETNKVGALETADGGAFVRDWGRSVAPEILASSHSHAVSATGGSTETRPVNMSVVWIMRVK